MGAIYLGQHNSLLLAKPRDATESRLVVMKGFFLTAGDVRPRASFTLPRIHIL
jgi:hypothetical protein